MSVQMGVTRRFGRRISSAQWEEAAAAWAAEVGPLAVAALKDKAPVAPQNGGRLKNSIMYTQWIAAHAATLEFRAAVPYAKYVLEGTPAHTITARRAQALHWIDRSGDSRFAVSVNHPGTKRNPFPERALRPLMPLIKRRFKEILAEAMGGTP